MAKNTGFFAGSVELLTSAENFKQQVTKASQSVFAKKIAEIGKVIEVNLSSALGDWLDLSPEVDKFREDGRIKYELGLFATSVDVAIYDIKAVLKNAVKVTLETRFGFVANLGIRIEIDIDQIANLPSGRFTSENGYEIHWLANLLLDGLRVIVYDYEFAESTGWGRTGGGIMINSPGGVWRVPEEVAGTRSDNFITRAIEQNKDKIEMIVASAYGRI